jgi:hypothetical protein
MRWQQQLGKNGGFKKRKMGARLKILLTLLHPLRVRSSQSKPRGRC